MYTLRLVERAQWVFFLKEMFNKHEGQVLSELNPTRE